MHIWPPAGPVHGAWHVGETPETRHAAVQALARAEQQQGAPEPVPYPPASIPAPDVPADNSAGPAANDEDPAPQPHHGLPVQRSRDSTRHGSFG